MKSKHRLCEADSHVTLEQCHWLLNYSCISNYMKMNPDRKAINSLLSLQIATNGNLSILPPILRFVSSSSTNTCRVMMKQAEYPDHNSPKNSAIFLSKIEKEVLHNLKPFSVPLNKHIIIFDAGNIWTKLVWYLALTCSMCCFGPPIHMCHYSGTDLDNKRLPGHLQNKNTE